MKSTGSRIITVLSLFQYKLSSCVILFLSFVSCLTYTSWYEISKQIEYTREVKANYNIGETEYFPERLLNKEKFQIIMRSFATIENKQFLNRFLTRHVFEFNWEMYFIKFVVEGEARGEEPLMNHEDLI